MQKPKRMGTTDTDDYYFGHPPPVNKQCGCQTWIPISVALIEGVFLIIAAFIGLLVKIPNAEGKSQPSIVVIINNIISSDTDSGDIKENGPTPTPLGLSNNSPTLPPLNAYNPILIPEWRNPNATQIEVIIPEGYDVVWINSDPAIFNGQTTDTRVAIVSKVNVKVQNLGFNANDGHFNIWAIALQDGAAIDIFTDPDYGLQDAPRAWVIDEAGQISLFPVISQSLVDILTKGELSVNEVQNCLNEAHSGSRPFESFTQGSLIPKGALIATNYGEANERWDSFPVIAICHNGSWGLFESIDSYEAPYEGAYWIIAS